MLKQLVLAGTVATALSSSSFAVVIANWTFEPPITDLTNSATGPVIAPTSGTGSATGVHASANADWTTPVGNGSSDSFSVNEWTVNDYFEFAVSTAGFNAVYVSFSQTSSNTGPRDFSLQYSTTGVGGPYTPFADYDAQANAAPNAWNSTIPVPSAFFSFDLTAIDALENNTDVVFRLVDTSTTSANGGTVATAGTSRVDDFTVSDEPIAPPVPEPSAILALISGAAVILARRRRLS